MQSFSYDKAGRLTGVTDTAGLTTSYQSTGTTPSAGCLRTRWGCAVGMTGKSHDPKAGLMDFSARWYDPAAGRFTQSDTYPGTLDDPISQHRYAFVGNNPINWTDPTGHMLDDGGGGGSTGNHYTYGFITGVASPKSRQRRASPGTWSRSVTSREAFGSSSRRCTLPQGLRQAETNSVGTSSPRNRKAPAGTLALLALHISPRPVSSQSRPENSLRTWTFLYLGPGKKW